MPTHRAFHSALNSAEASVAVAGEVMRVARPGHMLVTACVITVISAGCTAGLSAPVSTSACSPAAANANARPAAANGIVHEFSALVQQDGPAVVNISATPNAKHGDG